MLTTILEKVSCRLSVSTTTQLSIVATLSVLGPLVILIAGVWDAVNHIQNTPEFFWSDPHIVVYTGVSMVAIAAIFSLNVLKRNSIRGIMKKGMLLVIVGSVIQIISGFGDSLSHDLFGIDGLISFTHQPLEIGIVLSALGGFLIVKCNKIVTYPRVISLEIFHELKKIGSKYALLSILILLFGTI